MVRPWFILGLLHGRDKDGTREGNLKKSAFSPLLLSRRSLGRLPLVGRWNKARYKRGKRDGNLKKKPFLYLQNLILLHVTRVLVRSPPFKAKRNPEHLL